MKHLLCLCTTLFYLSLTALGAPFLVENGEARAQIVIAPERPRLVGLAALELQYYVEKISGARLPIVTEPGDGMVNLYIGASEHTEKLGVRIDGLQYGAYRISTGPDWMAFTGTDYDYVPPHPYPVSNSGREKAIAEWDAITADYTDTAWEMPWDTNYKRWWNPREFDDLMAERYGADNKSVWNPHDVSWSRSYNREGYNLGYWMRDESGSLNAVYSYLRSLGVRWYMPGDTGEVIPQRATIELEPRSVIDKPDFPMRAFFWYNYSMFSYDHTIWARRIGINSTYSVLGEIGHAHGLAHVHGRKEMQEKYPERYALYGGHRDTDHRGYGTACHSSEELVQEAINFGRFMFDHYDQPHISLFPVDGFKLCGCEKCEGKSASEVVWTFVDKVARELYKTHPDRIVSGGAYTSYVDPPESIDQFTPNVAVLICNRGRPLMDDPVKWEAYWSQVQLWASKLGPGRLMRVENNRYTLGDRKPIDFPTLHPRAMAKDLSALNGLCLGETNEESQTGGRWKAPGLDHLNLYINARFLWDAGQDIEAVLAEYFTLFYGPVAAEVQLAFDRAEVAYDALRFDTSSTLREAKINRLAAAVDFNQRLNDALAKVGAETIYGQRIQAVLDDLKPLAELTQQLEEARNAPDPRADAPVILGVNADSGAAPPTYELKDIVTGEPPEHKTTFQVTWEDGNLIFDFRCYDDDMESLFITDDVWGGDSVALMIETPVHAYYQIEVNPDGVIFDADRSSGLVKRWESQAQVTTEKHADHWRAVISIPVMAPEKNQGDPYHYVVGPKPSKDQLWYIQVGRVRVRPAGRVPQAIMATGGTYHDKAKFAKLAIDTP